MMNRRGVLPALFTAAVLLMALGCDKDGEQRSNQTAQSARVQLPPLRGTTWLQALEVNGHASASVAVPLGATRPRPVLIALHGAADRPEWQCGTWRGLTSIPFILCPRGQEVAGSGTPKRFTFKGAKDVAAELRAALTAMKARFGDHVAKGTVVLAGHGRGADLARHVALQEPGFFSKVVLIEEGMERWSSSYATLFAESGGERVLFACGRPSCGATAKRAVTWSQRAGLDARLVYGGPIGPYWDSRLAVHVRGSWDWLVGDDPRWKR